MWEAAASAEASRTGAGGWHVVVAERPESAKLGLQREQDIAAEVGARIRDPTIFIWRSQRALIVSRGQTQWSGFEAAAARFALEGWPVLVRRSGGGAFPISPGTVQLAMIARYPDRGMSMDGVYDRLSFLIGSALAEFGIAAGVGATPGAFCDGHHDLVVAGRKIAGLAQHWRLCDRGERCVTAAASVLVDANVGELAGIVDRLHALCGQAIDIRSGAMTTVRESCGAAAVSRRNTSAEFLQHLAAAAARMAFPADSSPASAGALTS